jgi:nicotinate-nucleotide adenylyltransferase
MKRRVGLFGGTFDPVHIGHLIVARAAVEHLELERMIWIPSAQPPHKPHGTVTGASERLEMVRLAIAEQAPFELSDCEIRRAGPSYTVQTVREFRANLGEAAELFWLIGADSLQELPSWYQVEQLLPLCRIVTAGRPGWAWDPGVRKLLAGRLGAEAVERLGADILPTPRIEISASQIRQRIGQGLSIRWLVPPAVEQYIQQRGLYRDSGTARG